MCELCFIIGFFVCQSRIIFANQGLFVQGRKYTKDLYIIKISGTGAKKMDSNQEWQDEFQTIFRKTIRFHLLKARAEGISLEMMIHNCEIDFFSYNLRFWNRFRSSSTTE